MTGLLAYGTYIPYWRLDAASVRAVLGVSGGKGVRAVAAFDEDSTTMGVEAARDALVMVPEGYTPETVYFVTTSPAYRDKTNAAAIHAALGLPQQVGAYDFGGATRSVAGALQIAQACDRPSLVIAADIRTGLPGSPEEVNGGDGAACLVFGNSADALADLLATVSLTDEFLDRWRGPGDDVSRVWEDRFGESAYQPLARSAFEQALDKAGVTRGDVAHLIVTGLHARAMSGFTKWSGIKPEAVVGDLNSRIGNTGSAALGLGLAHALDQADPDSVVVAVSLSDGVDVSVLRTTQHLEAARARRRQLVAQQVDGVHGVVSYGSFLTWRGRLDRDPPRRPNPPSPAAAPALRRKEWKYGLRASRCQDCGTRHLPAARVCVNCRATDHMTEERVADEQATVATYTVDRLAFSPSPPLIAAMVDYDGGGRAGVEIADAQPEEIDIGTRLEMTFRRLYTADNGIHNYFWKARPIRKDS